MGHGDQHINLPGGLNFAPDEARVDELIALMLPGTYHLGRPWTDREAWEKVRRSKAGERLLEEARLYETDDPRCYFTNEDCLYVMETDDRTKFDPLPPRARCSLALLPIVECLEPTGRLIPRIEELIRRLCAVNSWTFPLHEQARDFHERRDTFTDLASVHYAGALVTALHLLGDRLSAEIRDLIRQEVGIRIFQPFEERIKSGREVFWWVTVTHNWNSVCLSCILGCALRLKEDVRERAWYVAVVEKLIQHSEDGFEPSGFYTEGVAYWGYGFSHYVLGAELVFGVTGGKIDWLKKPKVGKNAHFSARMEIQEGAYPTFADCQKEVKIPQWLTHWLNNRIDPRRTTRATTTPIDPFDPIHFQFAEILHLILFHQVDLSAAYAGPETRAIREWFDDVQFLICRPGAGATTRMAATFKGGHNGANHNHNDLGAFTVLMGAVELLTDPGAEIYTVRTFSTHRYLGKLLNSFGHPVPVVAGQLQFPDATYHRTGFGRDAYAEVIDSRFTEDRDQVVLALDRAYKVLHLINLIRAFTYDRKGKGLVEVLDKVIFSSPDTFETALITYADWELMSDGHLRVSSQGEAVEVDVSSADGELVFDHCVIQESSTPTRLSWRFREPITEAEVRIRVTPLG